MHRTSLFSIQSPFRLYELISCGWHLSPPCLRYQPRVNTSPPFLNSPWTAFLKLIWLSSLPVAQNNQAKGRWNRHRAPLKVFATTSRSREISALETLRFCNDFFGSIHLRIDILVMNLLTRQAWTDFTFYFKEKSRSTVLMMFGIFNFKGKVLKCIFSCILCFPVIPSYRCIMLCVKKKLSSRMKIIVLFFSKVSFSKVSVRSAECYS